MTPDRWKQVEAVFEQALELPVAERLPFLERRCDGDDQLHREVVSLLDSHGRSGDFLERQSLFFTASAAGENGSSLSAGERIGRYRIVREIGRGGMGAVYLGERADEQYEKRVAIKLIKRGMDTDSVLRQFRNERQILASFDHPNIARLHDADGTENGLPFFVMEYIEGLPIDDYCDTHALSIPERLRLFREVCAAVSYAHRHLVVHRDLKRSNILVTDDGVPKLLDFGIAKLLQQGDDGAPSMATMTGQRSMTPQYASPEQMRGEPVTTSSDVYSLGVVLYELLTGQLPYDFSSASSDDSGRVVTETTPAKPSAAAAARVGSKNKHRHLKLLKGDLDNIVLMALRKEPARRYQSVEQFSDDIRRHLEALPVRARKDTVGYRASRFAQRNRTALAAAALVLLILVGGIIATSWQARIATREKARAERRFADVRELAHSLLFDYHDAIKDLPGATRIRERLLHDALGNLDKLAGDAEGDPALQRELAAAYERVAELRGGSASGSLGDTAGAIESHTKALKIRRALVALLPHDTAARSELARSHRDLGYQLQTGDITGRFEHLREARALYLDLTREQPANEDLQFDLANTCTQLGIALRDHSDPAGAIEQFRAAASVCEKLTRSKPHEQKFRHALWASYENMATALGSQNDLAGAMEASKKALTLGEGLITENPLSADYRRGLVLNYEHAGNFLNTHDDRGALDHYRRAAELAEQLVAADPPNVVPRRDLARNYKKMADCLVKLGDDVEALSHFKRALKVNELLMTDAPADLSAQLRAVACRAGVARMHARLGDTDRAVQECDEAKRMLDPIAEKTTTSPQQRQKAEAYEYLGHAYDALAASPRAWATDSRQHMSTARDLFRQSLDILEGLRSRGLLDAENEGWARDVAREIAKNDAALGR